MTTRRRLCAVALSAALLAACGRAGAPQGGETAGEIHFAVLSAGPARLADAAWRPVLADMERRTGLKVKLRVYDTTAALIEALRRKSVDAGLVSNQSGLEAVRRGGGEVFARTDDPVDADDRTAVLIANAKRKLTLDRALSCKRTLTLAMGDAGSTAGALAPLTYLFAPRGIDPQSCFKRVRIGAGPESDLAAVAKGELDLATVSAAALTLDRGLGGVDGAAVTVLWRSSSLPQNPVIRRKSLDPVVREKLRQFFLTYGQGRQTDAIQARLALRRVGIGGFEPADDSHLLPIREMEATGAVYAAKRRGDKAKLSAAMSTLDAITAQRVDLEARTRAPAAAQ